MGFLWIVLIGFVAGIIARLLSSAPNKPTGFILTTVLGIVGAFLATFIGQAVGWYAPTKAPALSLRPSAPSSCSSSGIGSPLRALDKLAMYS